MILKFNPALLRIFKLGCISILCCHWFGCIWWLVADLERLFHASEWQMGENLWIPVRRPRLHAATETALARGDADRVCTR